MAENAERDLLARLVANHGLAPGAERQLRVLAELLADDPLAPTAIRDRRQVVDRHLADSLVALGFGCFDDGPTMVDIGSGAGLPGLALAIARPESRVTLLEANRRSSEFLRRAVAACGTANASVVNARAEQWPDGLGRFDIATARAVAALDVVMEYAAPLLRVRGLLVAWTGRRDAEADEAAARAAGMIGMTLREVRRVEPFTGAQGRHLHLISKSLETPSGFPRRPGVAAKRPLGGLNRAPAPQAASDRPRR